MNRPTRRRSLHTDAIGHAYATKHVAEAPWLTVTELEADLALCITAAVFEHLAMASNPWPDPLGESPSAKKSPDEAPPGYYAARMDLRKALKQLQADVRAEKEIAEHGRTADLPPALQTSERQVMTVGVELARRIEQVVAAILSDIEYEHLGDAAAVAVWDFCCYAAVERSKDHVAEFMNAHKGEVIATNIYFGVEYLRISQPFDIHEVSFLPLPGEDTEEGRRLRNDPECGAMAKVPVSGTHMGRMVERGRDRAAHAVRILRLSLANQEQLVDAQLRFRLGRFHVVEDRGYGFHRHKDAPVRLEMDRPPSEIFPEFNLVPLTYDDDDTDLNRHLQLALGWIDAALLSTNRIHKVSFLFSALEAMLGEKAEGLKAPMLVFYRTVLGQAIKGYFPNPVLLYALYDLVRSYAVHGEEAREFTTDQLNSLEWSIRTAFVELTTFAERNNLHRRSWVRDALLKSQHAQPTLQFLRENDPEGWWADWSPDAKADRRNREQELAAEVKRLKRELQQRDEELIALRATGEPAEQPATGLEDEREPPSAEHP